MELKAKRLIEQGYAEQCPVCDGISVYASIDYEPELGIEMIGATSCFTWQCGHCDLTFAEADSIINHPCYTHAND